MKTLSFDITRKSEMAIFLDLLLMLEEKGVKYSLTQDRNWAMVNIG